MLYFCACIYIFFMYVSGQLSAIKNLYIYYNIPNAHETLDSCEN